MWRGFAFNAQRDAVIWNEFRFVYTTHFVVSLFSIGIRALAESGLLQGLVNLGVVQHWSAIARGRSFTTLIRRQAASG